MSNETPERATRPERTTSPFLRALADEVRIASEIDHEMERAMDKTPYVDIGKIYRAYGVFWGLVVSGWGLWLLSLDVFVTSPSYAYMGSMIGEGMLGASVLCLGLVSLVFPMVSHKKRSLAWLMPTPLIHAFVWGALTGLFFGGNPTSTGVWMYTCLTVMSLGSFGHINYLRG